jgi:hypothetical protein
MVAPDAVQELAQALHDAASVEADAPAQLHVAANVVCTTGGNTITASMVSPASNAARKIRVIPRHDTTCAKGQAVEFVSPNPTVASTTVSW